MIIEVVARQVGEGAGGDAHAVEPALVETVRGGLERQMCDALTRQPVERAMQFDRIGRGQRAVGLGRRRNHADGADAGGRKAERAPDLAREGGDRGLAAGAGDRRDGAGLAREEFRRRQSERAARIRHGHENDIGRQSVRTLLGGDRHRAGRRRGAREMGAVGPGAGNGEKQEAGFYLAAVGGNAGDIDARLTRIEPDVFKLKVGEFHRRVSRIKLNCKRGAGPSSARPRGCGNPVQNFVTLRWRRRVA